MSRRTLTLLDDVASECPLLLVIDDAHWIDRESAGAIAFVGRRMAGIDLALVAAVRDGMVRFSFASRPDLRCNARGRWRRSLGRGGDLETRLPRFGSAGLDEREDVFLRDATAGSGAL